MSIDPQIPIGKAMDNDQGNDDDEVTGHGLIFETGDPAASDARDAEEPAAINHRQGDDHPVVPDKE